MYPQTHFLGAWFLGEILVELGILSRWSAIICGILAVLIDLDHLIAFVRHEHKFDFRKAWNVAAITHVFPERTFIHHKTGVLIVTLFLLVMFFLNQVVFWVMAIAYYSHMFLDYFHFGIKSKNFKFKEKGFGFQISSFELLLDSLLVLGIIFLVLV